MASPVLSSLALCLLQSSAPFCLVAPSSHSAPPGAAAPEPLAVLAIARPCRGCVSAVWLGWRSYSRSQEGRWNARESS
jgi:hypothetical protein